MIQVDALPGPFEFEPAHTALLMIDMQRDFIEPGGFGAALGNDVSLLAPVVPAAAELVALCRAMGVLVVHTQECHRPDLSDCPPAKRLRGKPSLRIGDPGPMGRILIEGEPGAGFVPELMPQPGDVVIAKPGKGAFYGTRLAELLQDQQITRLIFGGVTTEVCVQTTRLRMPAGRGSDRFVLPAVQGGDARDDPGAGRDRRVDGDAASCSSGL